jgi:hypothetical protein
LTGQKGVFSLFFSEITLAASPAPAHSAASRFLVKHQRKPISRFLKSNSSADEMGLKHKAAILLG